MIKAFILNQEEKSDSKPSVTGSVTDLDLSAYPAQGSVHVAVSYSAMNYKDGMVVKGLGGLVRRYPHIPGIDYVGEITAVDANDDPYKVGDKVVVTGWRVGEQYWGGYSQLAKADSSWLVPLPKGLTERQAAAIGTAGFSAMLAIDRCESSGITPAKGPVMVTGAGGGVGSIAVMLLSDLGYEVVAMSGKAESRPLLQSLGAQSIVDRDGLSGSGKPLEKATFQAAIDTVGGDILGRVLAHMRPEGRVAAVGLASGAQFSGTILPFLLRGVDLLGVDSVMVPVASRIRLWSRLADLFNWSVYEPLLSEHSLDQVNDLAEQILSGRLTGRAVIALD